MNGGKKRERGESVERKREPRAVGEGKGGVPGFIRT